MSLFDSILEKLGLGGAKAAPAAKPMPKAAAAAPKPAVTPKAATASAAPRRSTAIPVVDVVSKLEGLAAASPQKLNWKTSIVDLLKLLGLDSSLAARKALATELGCPAEKMSDSALMNVWLHKTVLQRLAENGGNIPRELRE